MQNKIMMFSLAALLLLLLVSGLISMYADWKKNAGADTVPRVLSALQAGAPKLV